MILQPIIAIYPWTCYDFYMSWNSCLVNGVATLQCLPIVFMNIIKALLGFAGVTALVFIILAGFTLMNSDGDQKKVTSAKGTLTWAIVGLILIFLSFGIVNVIGYLTGVSCISAFGFTACV
jgi:hypothetical protein